MTLNTIDQTSVVVKACPHFLPAAPARSFAVMHSRRPPRCPRHAVLAVPLHDLCAPLASRIAHPQYRCIAHAPVVPDSLGETPMARSPLARAVSPLGRGVIPALALLAAPLAAQKPAPLALDSYVLPNGLQVILAEDHT